MHPEPSAVHAAPGHPSTGEAAPTTASSVGPVDLDAIEGRLADVETALRRLEDDSYWLDEVTGQALPDDLLRANPIARRA